MYLFYTYMCTIVCTKRVSGYVCTLILYSEKAPRSGGKFEAKNCPIRSDLRCDTQPLNFEEIAIKGIHVRAQGAVVR
jgi:hypothetical protein